MLAASLGIAGIGALASLAVYRGYFIALALAALGYSFLVTFKKKRRGGTLSFKNYRFGRDDFLLLVTTVIVIFAILFPHIRGAILAQSRMSYNGRGWVVGLDEKAKKITLKHEEIKGLMPAMTMEFPVGLPKLLDGVRQGDRVRFTLRPQGAEFVVENIAKDQE